jgi:hypothetical protein
MGWNPADLIIANGPLREVDIPITILSFFAAEKAVSGKRTNEIKIMVQTPNLKFFIFFPPSVKSSEKIISVTLNLVQDLASRGFY